MHYAASKRSTTIFLLSALSCLSVFTLVSLWNKSHGLEYFLRRPSRTTQHLNEDESQTPRRQPRTKLILLYNLFFGDRWKDVSPHGPSHRPIKLQGRLAFDECTTDTLCEITYDRRLLPLADAVGFHGPDLYKNYSTFRFPNRTRVDQIWFYYILENPSNYDMLPFSEIFNWTMTYTRDSEIHVPYGKYVPLGPHEHVKDVDIEYKDLLVTWMVSNCESTERNDYVYELQKHIQVDIYGGCGELNCPLPRNSASCRLHLKRYKFYLAFENGNCREYITEKYWDNAVNNDVVPVVMGGAEYANPALAIPNSYIDVREFPSPKDLAEYLLYLNRNDDAYLEYFQWKKLYKVVVPKRACAICAALHRQDRSPSTRIIHDMTERWSGSDCRSLNLVNTSSDSNSPFDFEITDFTKNTEMNDMTEINDIIALNEI